jgi:ribosomal protein L37AE/L43A
MRRAVLLVLLLSLSGLPLAQATGGVIDSVSVTGDGIIGAGPIGIDINLVGVGGASASIVNWSATLVDMEGTLIDSDTGSESIDDGINTLVQTNLSDAPLGFSNLTVSLSGDIGTPGTNQSTTWSTIIHRLRPLDMSIGTVIFTSVNQSDIATGNLTIRDGDHARIDVAVVNDGDVDWQGNLSVSVGETDLGLFSVQTIADQTQIVSILSNALSEGNVVVDLQLENVLDAIPSDDSASTSIIVGPPPLADLVWNLTRLVEPVAGSEMEWSINITNSGEVDYNSTIQCTFDNEIILEEPLQILISQSVIIEPSMTAKPGQLVCTSSDQRIHYPEGVNDNLSMTSAIFIAAGQDVPTMLQGPWHADDEIVFSLLVRNEGDAFGSATLQVYGMIIGNSSELGLDEDKAGELRFTGSFSSAGDHVVNWSVQSSNGAVDENLSGSLTIPVVEAQSLTADISSITVEDSGLEMEWSIDLDEGRERMVIVTHGTVTDGVKNMLGSQELILMPGISSTEMSLGWLDAPSAYIEVFPIGWTHDVSSALYIQEDLPDSSGEGRLELSVVSTPKSPTAGEEATLRWSIYNDGAGPLPEGTIVLTTVDGQVLGQVATLVLSAGTEESQSSVVTWPTGDLVSITATWFIGGVEIEDKQTFPSTVVTNSADSFTIPWGGIIGGFAAGLAAILALKLFFAPKGEKKVKKERKRKSTPTAEEKVEVACPECDRRLRVPRTYTGTVGCPECENKFSVEGQSHEPEPEPEPEEDIVDDEELWSSSSDDILECPSCSRKLKVPFDRRPAKARCPACETIFEARKA